MIDKLAPSDILGGIAIIGCLTLIGFHKDGTISSVLLVLVGHYFGSRSKAK